MAACIAVMLSCGPAWADVSINADNFPDEAFRHYVSDNLDSDDDGVLTQTEVELVKVLPVGLTYPYDGTNVNFSGSLAADSRDNAIHDLKGIEHFTELVALSFEERSGGTPMSGVDLSKNTKLEALQLKTQNPINLDLSANTSLKDIKCPGGTLSSLTLPASSPLEYLNCSNNRLKALNLQSITSLEYLNASVNDITSLDVSAQANLRRLYCANNALVRLSLPSNSSTLEILECQDNALEELNISSFTNLQNMSCSNNHLAYIDHAAQTGTIGGQTILKEISVSKITPDDGYEYVFDFTQLGISQSDVNKVTSFNATNASGTITTDFPSDGTTLSGRTKIRMKSLPAKIVYEFSAKHSSGTSNMDVTMTSFKEVVIDPPAITKPTSNTLPAGKEQKEYSQILTASGATPISWDIRGLPDGLTWKKDNDDGSSATISGTPTTAGTYELTVIVANDAGSKTGSFTLEIAGLGIKIDTKNFPDKNFRKYVLDTFDTDKDEWLSYAESKDVTSIDPDDDSITNLKGIEQFTALTSLTVPKSVTKLDLSKNTALITLDCMGCKFTDLDFSKNKALQELDVTSNDLSKLDLTANTALVTLKCGHNKMPELSLRANTSLTQAVCSPQSVSGTVTTSSNAEYPYKFSLTSIIAAENVGSVSSDRVTAYDSNLVEVAHILEDGVLYFTDPPASLEYGYATRSPLSTMMRVNVKLEHDLDPQITSKTRLTDGQKGTAYSFDIKASGTEPFTWAVSSGTLPQGLTLSEDTGKITGTPTEWSSEAFTFTVMLTGARKGLALRQFTLRINPATTEITTSSLKSGTSGSAYSFQLEAYDPDDTQTWTLTDGSLPRGLALDSSGLIAGTPSRAGTYKFTVSAEGPGGTATKEFSLKIVDTPDNGGNGGSNGGNNGTGDTPSGNNGAITITTSTLSRGSVGEAYSYQLRASGSSPIRWGISGGKLPLGLFINAAGEVSGIPRASGTFTFTVTASNSQGYSTKELTISIASGVSTQAPTITSQGLANGYTNTRYSAQLSAEGSGPISWTLEDGTLPLGLTLKSDGTITGTPTKAGEYAFTVEASNRWGKDYAECTILISDRQSDGTPEPVDDEPDDGGGGNTNTRGLVTGRPRGTDSLTNEELSITSSDARTIVAILPELTVNIADTYEIEVELNDSAVAGKILEWHPFPRRSGNGEDAFFTDDNGDIITAVPEDKIVHVVAYLEADRYRPVITATNASSGDGNTSSSGGGGGGCSSFSGSVMLLALAGLFGRRKGRR